jgi:methylphosphotriester-DNA--protein-cysteine methyltransferase
MAFIFHAPSPPLNDYIDCFYYPKDSGPYPRERILPLPALDLKINLGGSLRLIDAHHSKPLATLSESWAVGLWNKSHIVDWPEDMGFFGVSFKLGGAYPFLRLPLSELHNQAVPLDVIWGNFATEIRERLYEASTIQARFTLLEQLLRTRLNEPPQQLKAMQHAVAEIARQHGVLSIRFLSDCMGMSQKHLITQFKQIVGCTPKELARLYRFSHILEGIDPSQPVDWTLVAHQFCYHDQSHFIRDFKQFSGHAPSDYLRLRRQIYAESPEHAERLRLLPIG